MINSCPKPKTLFFNKAGVTDGKSYRGKCILKAVPMLPKEIALDRHVKIAPHDKRTSTNIAHAEQTTKMAVEWANQRTRRFNRMSGIQILRLKRDLPTNRAKGREKR